MKRLLIRTDDLGYSEGVNYGIMKTVKEGIIRTVGLMPNMPAAEHGVRLLRGEPVCFGQHTNISVGRPLVPPERIPSLVQANGEFKTSRMYNCAETDIVVLEEVILEIEAQYERFRELTGKDPAYFECHAVSSANLARGLQIAARRHGLSYLSMPDAEGKMYFHGTTLIGYCDFMNPEYDPAELVKQAVMADTAGDVCPMVVFHAGYLDAYLLTHSSLTIPRTKEVEAACDPELKRWLSENEVQLITYDDLKAKDGSEMP